MKKYKKILTVVLAVLMAFFAAACVSDSDTNTPDEPNNGVHDTPGDNTDNPPEPEIIYDDNRNITDYQFASSQISGTDALGRSIKAGDATEKQCDVGLFYFLWLGQHPAEQKAVYDVSKFEKECPEEISDPYSEVSVSKQYHHWGESLYGYYDSGDPWVLTRHVELFTAASVDFLVFDTTNAVVYDGVVSKLLKILDKFRKQGFAVPKVAFMTNTDPKGTATAIYNAFYAPTAADRYPDLWYSPNGKPFIVTDASLFDAGVAAEKAILDTFDIRAAQWPDKPAAAEKFPWMSWAYPQYNHNGVMSVSVAQHTTARMSNTDRNRGRGWSPTDRLNDGARAAAGSNIQSQWDTVFAANSNAQSSDDVSTVFVTGWNEWIALKLNDFGDVYFVDNYNAEYSRDIEMDKTAYGDNFYMQLVDNVHRLKYGNVKHYRHTSVTPASDADEDWSGVRSYPDFAGDAMNRNYRGYTASLDYTDNTARNDITEVKVASDSTYAYFRVECAADIQAYKAGDRGFMNVWLTKKRTTGYEYVINRNYGKLSAVNADGTYTDVADVTVTISGKVMTVAVALADIGVDADDPGFMFKVSDNVDASDVMNFYIQGDSAPIGRLSYTYGYVK